MELEGDWWRSSLALDHCNYLQLLESKLPMYTCRLSHMNTLRRYLVDWLAQLCETFSLCLTTRHLMISLLDFFMDGNTGVNELCRMRDLQLVGLAALLIAAKFEEREVSIPRIVDLNKCISSQGLSFSSDEYMEAELLILKFFTWSISLPTAAHFVDYFIVKALQQNVDRFVDGTPIKSDQAETYVKKFTRYFLEISLQSPECRTFRPSLVCAACICAARRCLHMKVAWSFDLQQHTGYLYEELKPVLKHLLERYERDKSCGKSTSHHPAINTSTQLGSTQTRLVENGASF